MPTWADSVTTRPTTNSGMARWPRYSYTTELCRAPNSRRSIVISARATPYPCPEGANVGRSCMRSYLLQDWTTIRGASTLSTVTQQETDWLDLAPFQDVAFWIDVKEVTNTVTLALQT